MRLGRDVVGAWLILLIAGTIAAPAKMREDDPLKFGTKWSGKLTQKGQIMKVDVPLEFTATLTVTKRDGVKFDAELDEKGSVDSGIEVTYLVSGEVTKAEDGKGYTVKFESHTVKKYIFKTFLKIPYTGTLEGKSLKGTWEHPKNEEGTTIKGEFTLELKE